MKPLTRFCFILLFALESSIIINTCFAGSKIQAVESKWQKVGSRWKVTIYNFQGNSVLNVHCKSKDDDLGARVLEKKANFDWSFKMNFWRTTLFWCNFNGANGHASFDVFWPEKSSWLSERCDYKNCIWGAFDSGLYLHNIPRQNYELIHHWKK